MFANVEITNTIIALIAGLFASIMTNIGLGLGAYKLWTDALKTKAEAHKTNAEAKKTLAEAEIITIDGETDTVVKMFMLFEQMSQVFIAERTEERQDRQKERERQNARITQLEQNSLESQAHTASCEKRVKFLENALLEKGIIF